MECVVTTVVVDREGVTRECLNFSILGTRAILGRGECWKSITLIEQVYNVF